MQKNSFLNAPDVNTQINLIHTAFKESEALIKLITEALKSAEQYIIQARSYVDLSWQKYIAIDSTYNDIQAKVLLEEMLAMHEHIGQLTAYFGKDLEYYCHERVELVEKNIHDIQKALELLRSYRYPITLDEFKSLKKNTMSEKPTETVKQIETVWSKIWQTIFFPFQYIGSSIKSLYHTFTASFK